MSGNHRILQRGWSLLEASAVLSFTLLLLSAGFGLIQYAWILRTLDATLDRYIYDSAVKPFELTSENGSVSVSLRGTSLSKNVRDIAENTESSIRKAFESYTDQGHSNYLVEIAYAEVAIDRNNGKAQGLRISPNSYLVSKGILNYAANDVPGISLNDRFAQLAMETVAISSSGETSISKYAVPTGAYGTTSEGRFLPAAVLLGGRASYSLENTFVGALLESIGMQKIVSVSKVVNLRGELG